jgi:tetraacyldisaccharide 4'-kinase
LTVQKPLNKPLLQRAWLGRGPLARALWPLALVFGALAALRRGLYRSGLLRTAAPLPVPVIVVGNVLAGGAGKTPLVIALVQHLQQRGWRPGVVSRGYGRQGSDHRLLTSASTPQDVGDEPLLIAHATQAPTAVGPRRPEAARRLLAAHPEVDVIVCDDGLQHYALARDIEVVAFDERGTGNGWLLPAGPLREHWPRRGDEIVLHTGSRPAPALAGEGFRAQRALAGYAIGAEGARQPLADWRGASVIALAGIAKPEAFFEMLRAQGLRLAHTQALPDHADFRAWKRPPGADPNLPLLCTEKDAVKLWPQERKALAVPLLFTPEPGFFAAIDQRLAAVLRGRLSSIFQHRAYPTDTTDGQQTP